MKHVTHSGAGSEHAPETLAELCGLGALMAPHWAAPPVPAAAAVPPSHIHHVSIPVRSARLLDAMSEYGD
ncbi:hypothetical protein CTZ27_06095 [Streptomyces griseocarneus]|nr:hypothetical protein CTZ27_06095 [Streptomyces griseocarneus]